MTPEQKFVLSCRQTGEAAGRLKDWLDHNPSLLGSGYAAVRDDLEGLTNHLAPLAVAADSAPCIGLLSTAGPAKQELLFSILAINAPTLVSELGQRPMDAAAIRSLLPSPEQSTSCAIHRYSVAEAPPAPRGFPLRIGLLSVSDLAAIIAGASYSQARPSSGSASAQAIADLFAQASTRLSPQALPGLAERDVLDLRDQLNARWPGNPTLATLAAARYWQQFREIAAHLTDKDRRRIIAVLWNSDRAYTTLFERLCDGLDKLGQGADAYCPMEALIGKDKASGWLARHPRSIVDAATLRGLDQPGTAMLAMMNRYGQTVDLDRAVAAGVIAELQLHLGPCRLTEFAPADLLDFPAPSPVGLHPAAVPSSADSVDLAQAIAHFARMKAIHLFERACDRREVTSLVAVVDPQSEDDTFADAIGDWVETAQGANSQAREHVRRGLFIAATPSSLAREAGAEIGDDRVQAMIREVLGGGQQWPSAWTPNRPMTEVFWFTGSDAGSQPTAMRTIRGQPQPTAIAPLATPLAQRSESNVTQLVRALALATDARTKHLQLNQSLQESRRRLRQTVLRHHTSNDPAAVSLWRRGVAVVVQDRLQYLIEQGRLGPLHRILAPSEGDLIVPMRVALNASRANPAANASPDSWRDLSVPAPLQSGFDSALDAAPFQASRLAEIAMIHWFKSMRTAARSQRLCRDLRIEMGVFHNLIDELQIGAIRCALASEIANAYNRSSNTSAREAYPQAAAGGTAAIGTAERELIRIAAYASRIIMAYLEVLGAVPGRGSAPNHRSHRSSPHDLEVAESQSSGYASPAGRTIFPGRRSSRPIQSLWEVSFVNLVEDNIASAHLLAGRGDKDRELGELIQLFASGPFEVEPWL